MEERTRMDWIKIFDRVFRFMNLNERVKCYRINKSIFKHFSEKTGECGIYQTISHVQFIEFENEKIGESFSQGIIKNLLKGCEIIERSEKKIEQIRMMKQNEKLQLKKQYKSLLQIQGGRTNANKRKKKKKMEDFLSVSTPILLQSSLERYNTLEDSNIEDYVASKAVNFYFDIYNISSDLNSFCDYLSTKKFIRKILKRYDSIFFIVRNKKNFESHLQLIKDFVKIVSNNFCILLVGFGVKKVLEITSTFELFDISCSSISSDLHSFNKKSYKRNQETVLKHLYLSVSSKNAIWKEKENLIIEKLLNKNIPFEDSLDHYFQDTNSVKFNYCYREDETENSKKVRKKGKIIDFCIIAKKLGWNQINKETKLRLVQRFFEDYIFKELENSKKDLKIMKTWTGSKSTEYVKKAFNPPSFTIEQNGDLKVEYWVMTGKFKRTLKQIRFTIPRTLFGIKASDVVVEYRIPTLYYRVYQLLCFFNVNCFEGCFKSKKIKI